MSLSTITVAQWLSAAHTFDSLIDARSEDEYALDHIPGALNWPTLNNSQRHAIGTMYVQVNPFEAKKRGAAIAARNIATHIERELTDRSKDWRPLTYCWRGGKRSGALSLILSEIGFRVTLLEGGYKAFRAAVVQDTPRLVEALQWRVVCGSTGSGKTRLLRALARCGAQVLDLEALANHRSSVLGALPGVAQPSQKGFDTLVWEQLRRMNPLLPVFVESESKKVGNVTVAPALMQRIRTSPCLHMQLPDAERVALLMEDYAFFVTDTELFCQRLEALTQARGKAQVASWQRAVRAGAVTDVVQELLTLHYDPVYLQSMQRNFAQFETAKVIAPDDHHTGSMDKLARKILQET